MSLTQCEMNVDDLLSETGDSSIVVDGFRGVSLVPQGSHLVRAALRARWVPGPALRERFTVEVDRVVDVIEDWEPVGCLLELRIGGVVFPLQRVLVAACVHQEVRVTMTVDPGVEEFGFNARFTRMPRAMSQAWAGGAMCDGAVVYLNGCVGRIPTAPKPVPWEYECVVEPTDCVGVSSLLERLAASDTAVSGGLQERWERARIEAFTKTDRGIAHVVQLARTADVVEDLKGVGCLAQAAANHRPLAPRVLLGAMQRSSVDITMGFASLDDVPDSFGYDATITLLKPTEREAIADRDVNDGDNRYTHGHWSPETAPGLYPSGGVDSNCPGESMPNMAASMVPRLV